MPAIDTPRSQTLPAIQLVLHRTQISISAGGWPTGWQPHVIFWAVPDWAPWVKAQPLDTRQQTPLPGLGKVTQSCKNGYNVIPLKMDESVAYKLHLVI